MGWSTSIQGCVAAAGSAAETIKGGGSNSSSNSGFVVNVCGVWEWTSSEQYQPDPKLWPRGGCAVQCSGSTSR